MYLAKYKMKIQEIVLPSAINKPIIEAAPRKSEPIEQDADNWDPRTPEQKEDAKFEANMLQEWLVPIKQNCSNAISLYQQTGKILYRGTRQRNVPAYSGKSRLARDPRDVMLQTQYKIDALLEYAGFKARRGNSIFTTGSSDTAGSYGDKVFMIFPKDTAAITWNRFHSDLYDSGLDDYGKATHFRDDWLWGKQTGYEDEEENVEYSELQDPCSRLFRHYSAVFGHAQDLMWDDDENGNEVKDFGKQLRYYRKELERAEDRWSLAEDRVGEVGTKLKNLPSIEQASADAALVVNYLKFARKPKNVLGWVKRILNLTKFYTWRYQKYKAEEVKALKAPKTKKKTRAEYVAQADKLGFVQGNLVAGIRSGKEIYVSGEYYAIAFNEFYEYDDGDDDDNFTNVNEVKETSKALMRLILLKK